MKGNIQVTVKVTIDDNFPITQTWQYTQDICTLEGLEEWIDLFQKILYTQGFAPYKLEIKE